MSFGQIGRPLSRVDGPDKVKGEAKYAGDFFAEGICYGFVLSSAIAKGKIKSIDVVAAKQVKGVVEIITHENRPTPAWFNFSYRDQDAPMGEHLRPLYDNTIKFSAQPIGLVVAETFEAARSAADKVVIIYETEDHATDLKHYLDDAKTPIIGKAFQLPPSSRGDFKKGVKDSVSLIKTKLHIPTEHHNPMEMHASTVIYSDDGSLKIYDKTQGVTNSKEYVCRVFGLSEKKVDVLSPFVGGAFGSGLRPQYQLFLAVMASTMLKKSIKVSLTRQQMFSFGHRPNTYQEIQIGADTGGNLTAISHKAIAETSRYEKYTEKVVDWSGMLYACPNVELGYKVCPLDLSTPLDMRAPGAALGVNAFEVALDELAAATGIDPVELRLKNFTAADPSNKDKPFSSKELIACYQQGADKFGWDQRIAEPGHMRRGEKSVGYGMATGVWEALQQKAAAKAILNLDLSLRVLSGTSDIGTGTYTIMSQIAADTLGLSMTSTQSELGGSSMPVAPLQGGSWTAASVGMAVKMACEEVGKELFKAGQKLKPETFKNVNFEDVEFKNEQMRLKSSSSATISLTEILKNGEFKAPIEKDGTYQPDKKKQKDYSMNVHSSVFVEVEVDNFLGTVEVKRVVSAVAGGKILNPKTARSQILGGVIWGMGMALQEETLLDANLGRFMNHSFAEYHIPVHKDSPEIEVIFVNESDDIVNPLGVKGLGEIGIVGVAAAISNAIFNATGKRIVSWPITLDKLL